MCELNYKLDEIVYIERHISEKTNISIVLRFWVKLWCRSNL